MINHVKTKETAGSPMKVCMSYKMHKFRLFVLTINTHNSILMKEIFIKCHTGIPTLSFLYCRTFSKLYDNPFKTAAIDLQHA